ncbi:MAG TPA: hypothetical protein VJN93_14095 [Candidatus Acidoferrum sp.]|nr:hypothetical protein [Candidatus Acidoferrum sp.]
MLPSLYSLIALLAIFALFALLIVLARWFFAKGWPRRIALSGLGLPVVVGIAVRQYLDFIGKPVMPWSWILAWFYQPFQLILLVLILAYWDIPFLIVAALAGKRPLDVPQNRLLVRMAYVATFLTSVLIFALLWRNTEAVVMILPLIPLFILPGTLAGYGLGWLLNRFSHPSTSPPPHAIAHP